QNRPHSALGNITPIEFAIKMALENRPHEARNETPDSPLNWREQGSQVNLTGNTLPMLCTGSLAWHRAVDQSNLAGLARKAALLTVAAVMQK
ncbi:hypothetical protein NKI57_31820, partial [Mesorhizobium sp. M0579]